MLALEVELFAPAAELAVAVAQFWVKAVGNAVEVGQTAEAEPAAAEADVKPRAIHII